MTSGQYGGAIYVTGSECVLSRICGFNCSVTSSSGYWGQFVYTYTKSGITYKNHVKDSSFTHSILENLTPYYALGLNDGNILCPSVNITNNKCFVCPALYCQPSGSPSSDTCCISYSSIVNNTARAWGCISLSGSSQRLTHATY